MPYQTRSELPKAIQDSLPLHAQDIWKEAFNHAMMEYQDPAKWRDNENLEEVSARVAWGAVKRQYKKDLTGKWVKKTGDY